MTIFLIICTIWHNGLDLRQDISYNNNLCARLVKMLYKTDTSTNVFPSLHVFNTLGCLVALYKSKGMKDKAWIKVIATIIGILIILSTIFLKQHSVWDVIGAFALAAILYPIVYVIPWGRKKQLRNFFICLIKSKQLLEQTISGSCKPSARWSVQIECDSKQRCSKLLV